MFLFSSRDRAISSPSLEILGTAGSILTFCAKERVIYSLIAQKISRRINNSSTHMFPSCRWYIHYPVSQRHGPYHTSKNVFRYRNITSRVLYQHPESSRETVNEQRWFAPTRFKPLRGWNGPVRILLRFRRGQLFLDGRIGWLTRHSPLLCMGQLCTNSGMTGIVHPFHMEEPEIDGMII